MASACSIKVRGVVQGVGFRPFVFRLARQNTLAGWVLNGEQGVEIFLEGPDQGLHAFVQALKTEPPPAAQITDIEIHTSQPVGCYEFIIRESQRNERPSVRISPDLPVCEDCLRELFDPTDKRYFYPYINCTNCGPQYYLQSGDKVVRGSKPSIRSAARLLQSGAIVAIKGLGGYHLACDAGNLNAVQALRNRKFRKERPFALMAKNLDVARALLEVS